MNQQIKKLEPFEIDHLNYREKDSFQRLMLIHIIAAYVISPVFISLAYLSNVPSVYLYVGASYSIAFPLYILANKYIPIFRGKFIFLFFFHMFIITLYTYSVLYYSGFLLQELVSFIVVYSVSCIVFTHLYTMLLYFIFVSLLLVYGFSTVEVFPFSKPFVAGVFIVIGATAISVHYARSRLMHIYTQYANYLRSIMNYPGTGYILCDLENDVEILDFNKEACRVFNIKDTSAQNVKNVLERYITLNDLNEIKNLKHGLQFKKDVQYNKFGIRHYTEIYAHLISLKEQNAILFRIIDVTDDVKKREELQISERKYKNLYYRNRAGVFTVDENSIILDANNAFFDMMDQSIQIGDPLFSLNQFKEWELILESFGEGESYQNYQTQFKLSDGTEKTFIFSWYFDEHTKHVEGSVIDLTNIQKTSQALKQSEEKYRLIFEESNDAILLIEDDTIIDANLKTIQLFGVPRNELIHKELFKFSANVDKNSKIEYDTLKAKLGNSRSVKFNWLFNGGNKIIEAEVSLIEISLGNHVYHQCVLHDTTDINKNIRAIRKNQQNLENILENTPEGFLIVQQEKIVYKNQEIRYLLGEDINLDQLFLKGDQSKFKRLFSKHLKEKSNENIQLNLLNNEQEQLTMDVTIVSTVFEEEDASLIILKDVSVQNTLAKEVLRAELAEETNKHLEKEITDRITAEKKLEEQLLRTKAILDSSSNTFLLTLDSERKVRSFNSHSFNYLKSLLKVELEEGIAFNNIFRPFISPSRLVLFERFFRDILSGKSRQIEVLLEIRGNEYWFDVFMNPIVDAEGNISEVSMVAHDISEKKKSSIAIEESLHEKEVLLKEIHHRVKNNLQVISSILNLQSSFVEDEKTLEILQESRNRIRSMAIIHENLYRTEDFSSIHFSDYLENLANNLISSYRINHNVVLNVKLQDVELILDQAIPCGLLVNELITNSLKYAWDEGKSGTIFIKMYEENNWVILEIGDDGKGLPKELKEMNSDTLGLQLVTTLVEQLDGEISADIRKGTKYLIKFEKTKP